MPLAPQAESFVAATAATVVVAAIVIESTVVLSAAFAAIATVVVAAAAVLSILVRWPSSSSSSRSTCPSRWSTLESRDSSSRSPPPRGRRLPRAPLVACRLRRMPPAARTRWPAQRWARRPLTV